jgi:hypothetical protein
MDHKSYRQLLRESLKSNETEEWLDVWFTRPIGLALALACGRVGLTPNAITIIGIVLGAMGGWLFHFSDLRHNVWGVVLLMAANFCDSADGQLARLTNQKTLLGRLLDGFASDVWFFFIYVSIVVRLWHEPMPFMEMEWQWRGFLLCAIAGFGCHATQAALADYYRQIHLWFLRGDAGSELSSYEQEQRNYDAAKAGDRRGWGGWSFDRLYHFFYKGYCRKQERLTPKFQAFFKRVKALPELLTAASPTSGDTALSLRERFLSGSRPLMPLTNILTHNIRAIVLFVAVLANIPYLYPLFEIVVLMPLYWYMRSRHEHLSETLNMMI